MPRKHRRVHHPDTSCRCPEGAKRVSTQKGRSFGCVAKVLRPGTQKPVPRFVKMVCGPEAGPVKQWKAPKGYKKSRRTKRKPGEQMVFRFNRGDTVPPPAPTPEQMRFQYNRPSVRPTPAQSTGEGKTKTPWWWPE